MYVSNWYIKVGEFTCSGTVVGSQTVIETYTYSYPIHMFLIMSNENVSSICVLKTHTRNKIVELYARKLFGESKDIETYQQQKKCL